MFPTALGFLLSVDLDSRGSTCGVGSCVVHHCVRKGMGRRQGMCQAGFLGIVARDLRKYLLGLYNVSKDPLRRSNDKSRATFWMFYQDGSCSFGKCLSVQGEGMTFSTVEFHCPQQD